MSIAATIAKLEDALISTSNNTAIDEYVGALLAAAGEALGVLRTIEELNVKQLMYDMARIAAAGGYVPDDFHKKAGGDG